MKKFSEAHFCPWCGVQALLRDDYRYSTAGRRNFSDYPEFVCETCGMGFKLTPSLRWHDAQQLFARDRRLRPPNDERLQRTIEKSVTTKGKSPRPLRRSWKVSVWAKVREGESPSDMRKRVGPQIRQLLRNLESRQEQPKVTLINVGIYTMKAGLSPFTQAIGPTFTTVDGVPTQDIPLAREKLKANAV